MATRDRLFHVVVLGGLALVADQACGGATTDIGNQQRDGGTDAESFPSELPVFVDSGDGSSSSSSGFPSELPVFVDAGVPNQDAGNDAGRGFPSELPVRVDGGK